MKKNSAFTLIELAIVIVIIGLLLGGVLQGKELIKQSKIRAQIKQFEEYDAAALIFKEKFGNLPGDITQARKTMFGLSNPSSGGNGNNRLDDTSGYTPNFYAWNEPYNYFIDLSDAELIKDYLRYSGANYNIGVAFPLAKLGDGGVAAISMQDGIYYFLGPTLKNDTSGIGGFYYLGASPSIAGPDAYSLDIKLDDGVPSTGNVRAVIVTVSTATNFNNDSSLSSCLGANNLVYNISSDQVLCKLVIKSKAG